MGQRLWDACSVIWEIFVVSENKQFSLLCNAPKTCVLTNSPELLLSQGRIQTLG